MQGTLRIFVEKPITRRLGCHRIGWLDAVTLKEEMSRIMRSKPGQKRKASLQVRSWPERLAVRKLPSHRSTPWTTSIYEL